MDGWQWLLLIAGAYVAVITLVRLMNRRRNVILEEIRAHAELESRRKQLEKAARNRGPRRSE
jgi:hypothetical protein